MSNSEFLWESQLYSDAPANSALRAALFTTYDRADERLLVEHVLPVLLKLNREPGGEGIEHQYFLLELDKRIKELHARLVVISSSVREEPMDDKVEEAGAYEWIWRSILSLTVGKHRRAVQHAKLWILHWGSTEELSAEHLEIVISSTNLTRAALRGQIQSVWRVCIPLHPQPSESRRKRWGILPHFLMALADSTGNLEALERFIELLARADCPESTTFVASVPGTYSRQELRNKPWGTAGLQKIAPKGRGVTNITILSPFIGSWDSGSLKKWCYWFGGSPDKCLNLIWVDKNHPWAKQWILPKRSWSALVAKSKLLKLRYDSDDEELTDRFHDEHRSVGDDRWSHAKLYYLKRATSRRVLLTSANFSPAAWGAEASDGSLTIENFELGVCIEQAEWPFNKLKPFEDAKRAATVPDNPHVESNLITWASASWDGNVVQVACRCDSNISLFAEIRGNAKRFEILDWKIEAKNRLRSSRVSWRDTNEPPSTVRFACELESLSVHVFDTRPLSEREESIPPEVDQDTVLRMRDEMLFEQYGGRVLDEFEGENALHQQQGTDGIEGNSLVYGQDCDHEADDEFEAGFADNYDVPAFTLARRHLSVVDNWAQRVRNCADSKSFEHEILCRDGESLIKAFQRQIVRDERKGSSTSIGARLAAEEIELRLNYFKEQL